MHASFASSISGLLIEFITNVLCTAILPVSAVPIVKHQAQDDFSILLIGQDRIEQERR